jgi:nitrogen fixation protein FixH
LEVPRDVRAGEHAALRFSAVDARGVPIENADVRVTAYRPSDASADFVAPLAAGAPGQYQADVVLPLPGVWDLNVTVQRGDERFVTTQRIAVLAP